MTLSRLGSDWSVLFLVNSLGLITPTFLFVSDQVASHVMSPYPSASRCIPVLLQQALGFTHRICTSDKLVDGVSG